MIGRCIRQFVLIAEKTVKSRSSLTQADPFSVESATQKDDHQDTELTKWAIVLA